MRTRVHLVRHGEVFNPDGVLYGRLSGFHLSDTGKRMAQTLGDYFKDLDVAYLASSPLERARETAQPIGDALDLAIEGDHRLIEAQNDFEGTKFAMRKISNWHKLVNPLRPSWGEPYTELVARMNAAVNDAHHSARGHEAVCVSHQLPIWVARQSVEGKRLWHHPRKRECAVGSVTTIEFDDNTISTVTYAAPCGDASTSVPGA